MSGKHWGEIHESDASYVPDVSTDIEKSMNKFCLAEFDPEIENDENSTEHLVLESMDPLIMYAISLHKYMNNMTETIRVAELAIESNLIPPEDAIPPIPEKPIIQPKHSKTCLNFISKQYTKFTEGENVHCAELSSTVARQILTKCVATMCAHIGYETTHNSVLILLTDVLINFLNKISIRLKSAREDELTEGLGGFPSYPEKVLVEFGMDGFKGLHDYYQNRVIKYTDVLYQRCQELNQHYVQLLIPKSLSPTDHTNNVIRVVPNEEVDEVQQIHFPGIEGEVGLSCFEPGLQLLNSLEAETKFVPN